MAQDNLLPRLNISIDDVSPHPNSGIDKLLPRFKRIIERYPDVKFTLFVPTAYFRQIKFRTEKPLLLSDKASGDFCRKISSLWPRNFELGYHGHFHSKSIPSDNDEFHLLSFDDATERLIQSCLEIRTANEVHSTSMGFSPVFRPPAWRINAEALRALSDSGIKVFALAKENYTIPIYGDLSKYNVVWRTCDPPARPLVLEPRTCIVYHACEWDKNYLSDDLTDQLIDFLKDKQVKYCFMEEINE